MEKKTIVITGSTKGIGLGLARELLKRGHRLVINGRDKQRPFQNDFCQIIMISS